MPYAPALLLLLFTAWAGTFEGAASAAGAGVGTAMLLLALVWAGLRLDPLGLGRAGRYLVAGLLVALAASAWISPVTRAGLEGLLLLPAWLSLPAATAVCWRHRDDRRRGLAAVAAVVLLMALWALSDWLFTASPRPSQPLGHHNLLALWLVTLLPLAALPMGSGRWGRGLGIGAVGVGLVAVLATRSLAGILALLVPWAGLWLVSRRRRVAPKLSWILLVFGFAALAWVTGPRMVDVISGGDPSAQARRVYLQAGLEGTGGRPVVGWGPGATPWTLALFLDPVPGVNPPSEVVGQVHSLPLQLAYETGLPGFLLVLAIFAVFALRRWRGVGRSEERTTVLAALSGLAAAAVASLGTAGLTVTALPAAWGVTAGAALAASERDGESPGPHARARTAALVLAALLLVALLPWLRARHLYERAAEAPELEGAQRRLAAAVELDPRFPLYRARWAWATGSAADARRAAADAVGIAPLWLQAGVLGLEAGESWARDALRRACRLDPFSPFAPWFLARSDPQAPEAPRRAARALLLEPRLVGALLWETQPELRAATRREIAAWPGVDPGLKTALRDALDRGEPPSPSGEPAALVLTLEARADQPFALHAFRRLPWPARLAAVPVRGSRARAVELPSAARRPETKAEAFRTSRGCR